MKQDGISPNPQLEKMLLNLAICHTVIAENKVIEVNGISEEALIYNASSPDELALTNGARAFGLVYLNRDEQNILHIEDKLRDQTLRYELLNVIEFTSARKCMSVIVRDAEGSIILMTKGADNIILPKIADTDQTVLVKTQEYLKSFAQEGLRTLVIAQKHLSEDFYQRWNE